MEVLHLLEILSSGFSLSSSSLLSSFNASSGIAVIIIVVL
jgi:hypothetical protein